MQKKKTNETLETCVWNTCKVLVQKIDETLEIDNYNIHVQLLQYMQHLDLLLQHQMILLQHSNETSETLETCYYNMPEIRPEKHLKHNITARPWPTLWGSTVARASPSPLPARWMRAHAPTHVSSASPSVMGEVDHCGVGWCALVCRHHVHRRSWQSLSNLGRALPVGVGEGQWRARAYQPDLVRCGKGSHTPWIRRRGRHGDRRLEGRHMWRRSAAGSIEG